MNNEEMIQKAAEAMVPILKRESNMIWGKRSCANILRWTLTKSGFRLTPVGADGSISAPSTEIIGVATGPPPKHNCYRNDRKDRDDG